MEIKEYLKLAKRYHKNPRRKKLDRITYLTLGFAGECGEVTDEIKKVWRNKGGKITKARRVKIIQELGDVQNIMFRLMRELNCTMEEVLDIHLEKLKNKEKPF